MTQFSGSDLGALRQRLLMKRQQQSRMDTNRGALLIRGRLFTWLATTRTRLQEANRPVPKHIAAYWALDQEPDLLPLLYQLADEEGFEVSLPCVVATDTPLVFRPWHEDMPMKTGAFGIQEPDTEQVAPNPDVVLVPTLGFTREGDRLGYGKGFYDRTLGQLHEQAHPFTTIGIAWAVGDLSDTDYHCQHHDVPLDGILTDKGWPKAAPVL